MPVWLCLLKSIQHDKAKQGIKTQLHIIKKGTVEFRRAIAMGQIDISILTLASRWKYL